jgi:hypothetical protein
VRRLALTAVGLLCVLAGVGNPAGAENVEQRWLVLTNPGKPTKVVATGVLNASGTVTDVLVLNPDGTFDNFATQTFPDGNLLDHGQGTFAITVDPRTCIGEGDVVGPFEITGGTGAYEGASGEGVALISLTFWFDKTDTGCSPFPLRTHAVAKATGTLDLP